MPRRLTDKQKKDIIADYVVLGTIAATARKHKVSRDTVSRLLREHPEAAAIAMEKREENSKEMLAYLDERKDKAQHFIDLCLDVLLDKEKIMQAPLSQITTAMGTVIDKFTMANNGGELDKLDKLLEKIESEADRQTS